MIFAFQFFIFALIITSFLLVIRIPVSFASTNGWAKNKIFLLSFAGFWFILVFAVGILNFFVVLF